MTENALKAYLHKISKTTHKYCGNIDTNDFRNGNGCEEWSNNRVFQKYSGQFLYNNLHNRGIYKIDTKGDQTYFDGLFYANKLEGYGRVIYSEGSVFEGLFKQHNRYGPGVFTYPDKSQDVGFWDGFSLMRLSVVVEGDFVPRLGKTSLGKARLLKFKTLVPMCTLKTNKIREILRELGDGDEFDEEQLYNLNIRNIDSLLFNKNLYDSNFFTEEECILEIELTEEEFEEEIRSSNSNFTEEDLSKDDCECFKSNFDRITHICAQLAEVEQKLEKVRLKKQPVEEQFNYCKTCCEQVTKAKIYQAKHKKSIGTELSTTVLNESATAPNPILERSGGKEIFLIPTLENEDPEISNDKQEIELHNYLYVNDTTLDCEDEDEDEGTIFNGSVLFDPEDDEEKLSRITLPFDTHFSNILKDDLHRHHSKISNTDQTSFTLSNIHYFIEDNESLDYQKYSLTCHCNEKLVDNFDVLERKLETLNQEELFYSTVKTTLTHQMDAEIARFNEMSQQETKFTKKIKVKQLLAWNNEEIWIKMLQHCFRHKNSENNVSYNIVDVLTGYRHLFKKAGIQETSCQRFLVACYQGHHRVAFNCLRTYNINPDVCDAKGNTGIMLAAISDKTYIIGMLANCGGKIDTMNDEGLTPLSMCLLKYISLKHNVYDWELAFLQDSVSPGDLTDMQQWCFPVSLIDIRFSYSSANLAKGCSVKSISFMPFESVLGDTWLTQLPDSEKFSQVNFKLTALDNHMDTDTLPPLSRRTTIDDYRVQKYIFDMEYKKVPQKKKKKGKPSKKKKSKKGKKDKKKKKNKKSNTSESTKNTKASKKNKKKSNTSDSTKSTKASKKKKSKTSDSTKSTKSSKKKKKKKETSENELLESGHKNTPRSASGDKEIIFNSVEINENEKKFGIIKKTIKCLLSHGADPNIGEVPLKLLFLAIFTNDAELLEGLLDNKADPNVTTNENLSCLHVIASLNLSQELVKMCELLFRYNIDPNIKTRNTHWNQLHKELLGTYFNEFDSTEEGKNALHLLCLREDFIFDTVNHFEEIARILVNNGCKTSDLYLGHSPLSLSVFRGNIQLIKALLNTGQVDPHLLLGNDMGNALTILVLKRFTLNLSEELKKEIVDCLVDNGLNPLNEINNFENAIAFMQHEEKEKEVKVHKTKKKKKSKKKGGKKSKSSKSTKSSKKSKGSKSSKKSKGSKSSKRSKRTKSSKKGKRSKSKHKKPSSINKYIEEKTRKQLFKHLQSRAVEYLYTLITEAIFTDPLIIVLAKHVTPEETIKYIQLLFRYGIISQDRFSHAIISDLLEFVKLQHKFVKMPDSEEKVTLEETVKQMSWSDTKCEPHHLLSFPEVERGLEKYEVCFQCLQGAGKKLVKCPSCELVSFCSEECNFINNKTCDLHKCKIIFYNTVKKIMGTEPQPSRVAILLEMANKVREEKKTISELEAVEKRMSRLKFKRKALIQNAEELQLKVKRIAKEKIKFAHTNSIWDFKEMYSSYTNTKTTTSTEEVSDLEKVSPIYKAYSTAIRNITEKGSKVKHNLQITNSSTSASRIEETGSEVIKKPKTKNTPKKTSKQDYIISDPVSEINVAFRRAKILPPKFEPLDEDIFRSNENEEIPKRMVPNKKYYTELLSKIFADFNLPLLLLPYACYKDGQVYYTMNNNNNMYLGKHFQKLKLPS